MTQGPGAQRTLYGLQYHINPKAGAGLGLPLTTNPINFSAMRENGLSANAWGVRVKKPGAIYIYCRDHMKELKISLHKSGMQFVAFTNQSDIKMTGKSRLWHRWREPEHQALIAGMTEPADRRRLAKYGYRISRKLIGNEAAESLMYPPLSSFGVVGWFRLQQRYGHILSKLFPGRRQNSNFTRFTSLLETSLFDEEGIRYTLPDHVYAEESGKW